MDVLAGLDESQVAAVTTSKHMVSVIAGAGSGKTTTITRRIAWLIKNGVDPHNILLLTFTRAAAEEMKKRIQQFTGIEKDRLMAGTFHSVFNKFLRTYFKLIEPVLRKHGKKINQYYEILDENDAVSVMRKAISGVVDYTKVGKNSTPLFNEELSGTFTDAELQLLQLVKHSVWYQLYSYKRNSMCSSKELLRMMDYYIDMVKAEMSENAGKEIELPEITEEIFDKVFALYEMKKSELNAIDFDDLLTIVDLLLSESEQFRKILVNRFKYIFVDEFQDTNRVQVSIIKKLAAPGTSVYIVGDDAQSIYSFRGADLKTVSELIKQTHMIILKYNYRSSKAIVEAANAALPSSVIQRKQIAARKESGIKPVVYFVNNELEEASKVVSSILEFTSHGHSYKDIAVIYRSDWLKRHVERQLLRVGIPYYVLNGRSFLDRRIVKDIIAFLRLTYSPTFLPAWERLVEYVNGIGPKTLAKLLKNGVDGILQSSNESLVTLGNVVLKARDMKPDDAILLFINEWYNGKTSEKLNELDDDIIRELVDYGRLYTDVHAFVDDILTAMDTNKQAQDRVTLTTVHSAKGLEWPIVFVIGVDDGKFPNQRAVEDGMYDEEERLFYVAVTRAKDKLYIFTKSGSSLLTNVLPACQILEVDAYANSRWYY